MLRAFKTAVRGPVTGCHDNGAERRDRLILANAATIGPRPTGAGLMIGTTMDTIDARRLQRSDTEQPPQGRADHRDGVLR